MVLAQWTSWIVGLMFLSFQMTVLFSLQDVREATLGYIMWIRDGKLRRTF
ncbi:hypothetical protein NC653_021810 [Populus alba x Populus x berolinensis]|uniref:Uncharacterized protein n=1 Tax=Populus alba x Populus x berolinensis TaxID=444605 RepID=A0AAD6QET9_9ROSI|nr:hypothetical protein NC653_021810 [Populus alba x Populus x berolinensis]